MTSDEPGNSYYYERAEAELKMAQKAQGAEAVRAHYELANLYLDRCHDTRRDQPADNDR